MASTCLDIQRHLSALNSALPSHCKNAPMTIITSSTAITSICLITFADAVVGFNRLYYYSPLRLPKRTKNVERTSICTLIQFQRDKNLLYKPHSKPRCRNSLSEPLLASPSVESDEGSKKSQASSEQVSASRRSTTTTNKPVDAESKRQPTQEKDLTSDRNNKGLSDKSGGEVKATKLRETVIFKDKEDHDKGVKQENKFSTPESSNSQSATFIQGLLTDEDFGQACRRHITLTLLRKHFPTLLGLPALKQSTAKWIYDKNVTVTTPSSGSSENRGGKGNQEILAMGLDEVLGITRALAVAATAARRAGSLLDLAVGVMGRTMSSTGDGDSEDDSVEGSSSPQVECELLIDPENPLEVLVLWRTQLPAVGIPSAASPFEGALNRNSRSSSSTPSFTEFSGKSIVSLSPETGLVTNLQIQKVQINGVPIIESIGTALATVRSAAKTAMASSPLFDNILDEGSLRRSNSGNPFLDGILNGIQREFSAVVDAVDAVDAQGGGVLGAPLYILPESGWKEATFPIEETTPKNETAEFSKTGKHVVPMLIEDHISDIPLPGSDAFVLYATIHQAMSNFAKVGLPRLSGNSEGSKGQGNDDEGSIRTLFTTDAGLVTNTSADTSYDTNNAVFLLRGAGKIADLYRSMALLREASGGDWAATQLKGKWRSQSLEVSWKSESPLKIEGTDVFSFEAASMSLRDRLPLVSDGDKDEIASRCSDFLFSIDRNSFLKINRIENRKLTIAGATADPEWAKSFVSAAIRSGWTDTPLPDPTIAELLRALTKKRVSSSKKSMPKKEPINTFTMPYLSDEAAASFYGILRALYRDLPSVGNSESHLSTPPAGEYLADSIELHGLLNEVLARGSKSYNRLVGLALSSLRAAIQTNRVRLAATPRPTIQITPRGSIKVDFILALWIDSPSFPIGGPRSRGVNDSNNSMGNGGFGVPLKIEVDSEYIIDGAGKISEHRINETRLNGILTPGDVFSSWIKRLAGESGDEERDSGRSRGAPSALDSLVDAIAWVRSMQGGKGK